MNVPTPFGIAGLRLRLSTYCYVLPAECTFIHLAAQDPIVP